MTTGDWIPPGATDITAEVDGRAEAARRRRAEKQKGYVANGQTGAAPDRFHIDWYADIKARLESRYIVKRWLYAGDVGLLVAGSGDGKTHLADAIAFHVANGMNWRGWRVRQCGVVHVVAEGSGGIDNRIAALRHHHQVKDFVPLGVVRESPDFWTSDVDATLLIKRVRDAESAAGRKVELIIIDTLNRVMPGGDENDPADLGRVLARCARVARETGACVLVVHHLGKDPGKGARGHSSLRGFIDTEITLTRDKASKIITAKLTKQRDGEDGLEFAFRLHVVELGIDQDGDPVTACVAVPTEVSAPGASGKPLPAECLTALDYLNDLVADHGQAVSASGIPSQARVVKVDEWREHLKRRGLHEGGEAGKKWFQRTRNRLIAGKRIAVDGDFVWPVKEASK